MIVIDNWLDNAEELIKFPPSNLSSWKKASTLYPGIQSEAPRSYMNLLLNTIEPYAKSIFNISYQPVHASSFYGIVTSAPSELNMFQKAPHVDTLYTPQLASIHYLCDEGHGGTSFYRHRKTGYETLSLKQWPQYRTILQQELSMEPESAGYIEGSNNYFECIKTCSVKFNRLIIYPSQLLHSGQIKKPSSHLQDIRTARLTINSFVGYYIIGP